MATGNYGTKRLATVNPSDIEVLYSYTSDRTQVPNFSYQYIDATQIIQPYFNSQNQIELLGGMYNMTLPSSIFNQKGIYTLMVRPKQIRTTILDCGSLISLPNRKGIVLNFNGATDNQGNIIDIESIIDEMIGYQIQYLDDIQGQLQLRNNLYRVITSANRCEVVSSNVTTNTQKATTYRLTDSGNLLFLTLSPSSSSEVRPNRRIFIGSPNQNIIISNTHFNPVMFEIELTEYDLEQIGDGIYGTQARDVNNGVVSFYNEDNEIIRQKLFYKIKDENDEPLFEIGERKIQIDTSQDFNVITDGI